MDTSALFDLAGPVRYALTHRPAAGDRVDLVLDLFRGAVQIHTRVIASVEREEAVLVMAKCRRYLQLRGVDAVPAATASSKTASATTKPSPVAAPKPSAVPMRPSPGVKPMAIPKPATAVKRVPLPATARPALREQAQANRAPAAAAFDWMFEAV